MKTRLTSERGSVLLLAVIVLPVAALLIATLWLTANILRAPTGRAWVAIRDSEIAAQSMGVNLALYKTMAFAYSAALMGVVAEYLAQRPVQQVRAGVVRHRRRPPLRIDDRADVLAGGDGAVLEHDRERLVAVEAVRLDHRRPARRALQHAVVGDLAAALSARSP